ncbi:hypothetical protein ACWD3Z_33850 [Streptomyces sp. NPDC002740]
MTDARDLLAAYDAQLRGAPPHAATHAPDGPLTRAVGPLRALVSGPPDLGLHGRELDELIARQRDFFAARGEAVEWRLRAHDTPADLPDRLAAAGFTPHPPSTVLIGPVQVGVGADLPQCHAPRKHGPAYGRLGGGWASGRSPR